jgi:hypothetical protein
MIGDGARWLCLLGDLVKAKWVGRQHHQHRHQHRQQHRHAAASMDPVWSPETPSRAARASAAFRQDSCLQRGAWPPSAALPASAHGPKSLQNSRYARRWPSGDAAAGLLSIAIAVALRAATDGEGPNQRAAGPGQGEHHLVSAWQPIVPLLARAVPHTPETRTAVGAHDVLHCFR